MEIIDSILRAACGKDENGIPNSAITLSMQSYSVIDENEEPKIIGEHPAHKPVVNCQKHGEFMQVDLVYPNHADMDLQVMWRIFERYGSQIDAINDRSTEIPILALTIVPLVYEGCYYIVAINPIFWTLQPTTSGGQTNVIRLLYKLEDFSFYEASAEDINIPSIEKEVDRAVCEQEEYEKEIMNKQQEREKYEQERAARTEEIRRNGEI